MKPQIRLMAQIIAACGVFVLFFGSFSTSNKTTKDERLMKRLSKDQGDDPWAREAWEFLRLRDPATGQIPRDIRAKELAFASTLPQKEWLANQLGKSQTMPVFNWTKRGPYNVGGRTRALGIDVRTTTPPNVTIIAGGVSGGMWKSTDDGASWTKTTAPSQLHSITCLAQDTRSGQQNVWYAGSGEARGNSASGGAASFRGGGIYKSTDNGSSWTLLPLTASNTPQFFDSAFDYVHNVAVDPTNGNVYAAASNTIQQSTNGGTNWTVVRGLLADNSFSDVQVASNGIAYAVLSSSVTNGGIWRSPDGVLWTQINAGVAGFPSVYSRVKIALAPSNPNVVFFLVQQADTSTTATQIRGHQLWKYTYVSNDGSGAGGTWVNRGGNLPLQSGLSGNARFDTQGGYDIDMVVKPNDENYLILGGVNLYRSTDAFATTSSWIRIGGYSSPTTYGLYPNHHPDQHSGMFLPGSNTVFYSGNDGGISKTNDVTGSSVAWNYLNNGYLTSQFYTVAIDHGTPGDNVVFGGLQDNGTWWTNNTNANSSWVDVFGGDGAYCAIGDGKTSYYVSSQNGNMYRLILDAAGNWGASSTWANIQPTGATGYLFINPFVLDPNDTKKMYLSAGTTIWRNTDLTAIPLGVDQTTTVNWIQLTNTNVSGNPIVSLAISKTPSNRLYYATYNSSTQARQLYRLDGAATGNPTPSTVTGSNFPTGGYISSIAINPNNADQVLVVFSNYSIPSLFYTTDGGSSWTDVSGNLEQNPTGTGNGPSCRWGAVIPTSTGTNYFVATSTGVYSATSLSGSSTVWAQEGSTTIGNVVVDMLDYRTSDGLVVAATHGNGVYSTNIVTSVSLTDPIVPSEFNLAQNYPNPFNPSTTIRYALPTETSVELKVFDLQGREVATLVEGKQAPGTYTFQWKGKDDHGMNVSSGTYFYRLVAGDRSLTKRMVLAK